MTKSLEKQLIDRHNLAGKTFGKWTVIKYLGGGNYESQCQCGFIGVRKTNELICMRSTQCSRCRMKEMRSITKNKLERSPIGFRSMSIIDKHLYSIRKEDLDE